MNRIVTPPLGVFVFHPELHFRDGPGRNATLLYCNVELGPLNRQRPDETSRMLVRQRQTHTRTKILPLTGRRCSPRIFGEAHIHRTDYLEEILINSMASSLELPGGWPKPPITSFDSVNGPSVTVCPAVGKANGALMRWADSPSVPKQPAGFHAFFDQLTHLSHFLL